MKSKLVFSLAVSAGMLVATPASAYVFTCVPPTEHAIGPKNPNVMLMLDVTGSMNNTSGEDVDGDGNEDSRLKVAKLAIDDFGNSIYTPGPCLGAGDPQCDEIILGLSVFSGSQSEYAPGVRAEILEACAEDSAPAVIAAAYSQSASSSTNTDDAMALLGLCPDLNDPSRPNIAVVITDGQPDGGLFATAEQDLAIATNALTNACNNRNRAVNPITTFMVGLGSESIEQMNSVMAAAGGTGQCCVGATAPCAAADQIDPCSIPPNDIIASSTALQTGYHCMGSIEATGSDLKDALLDIITGVGCVFPLDIPPGYPMGAANADPDATEVTMYHTIGGPIPIPPAGRGMDLPTVLESFGMPAGNAATYLDEGWEFTGADRRFIRFTPNLCAAVAGGDVSKVTTEVACACPLAGQPCTLNLAGFTPSQLAVMRCADGVYECVGINEVCVPGGAAMPEICNGLDDDCDGITDNMKDSWEDPAFSALSLPANRVGIDCNRNNTCMCPSGMRDDQAGTDFASYVAAWDPVCECGEGLAAPLDYSASPDQSPSAPTQDESAACSTRVAGTPGGAGLLAFGLLIGGLWMRRRVSR